MLEQEILKPNNGADIRWLVGSSRSRRSGSLTRALARKTRRFHPADNNRNSAFSSSSVLAITVFTRW